MAKRKDINETAFDIVNELTSDEPPKKEEPKPRKKTTSRMTPEERRERAKKAAAVRWGERDSKGDVC